MGDLDLLTDINNLHLDRIRQNGNQILPFRKPRIGIMMSMASKNKFSMSWLPVTEEGKGMDFTDYLDRVCQMQKKPHRPNNEILFVHGATFYEEVMEWEYSDPE